MHKITYHFVIVVYLSIIFTGCSKPPKIQTKEKATVNMVYHEKKYCVDKKAKVQRGNASYYASCFHGQSTASGETCNIRSYTAAHRTLPFGTIIRVTMLKNGKSVLVKVNDRGPFTKSRVVDLSPAAAKKIGLDRAGIGKVKIEILKKL